jgi:hypothetical protein
MDNIFCTFDITALYDIMDIWYFIGSWIVGLPVRYIVNISFGYILYCGCFNLFCNVWVCVCGGIVMCECVYVGFVVCGCGCLWIL